MSRLRRLRMPFASAIGLGPGFVLPFAIALTFSTRTSDLLLLCISLSTVAINVVVVSIEAAVVPQTETRVGLPSAISGGAFRRLIVVGPAAAILTQAVVWTVLLVSAPGVAEYWLFALIYSAVPIVGVLASIHSGRLIADGRVAITTLSQSFRSLLPLGAVIVFPNGPTIFIAVLALAGESIRFGVLRVTAGRLVTVDRPGLVKTKSLLFSTALMQGNPVFDRALLAGAGVGAVSSYELADKAYHALFQILYAAGVVPKLGGWSRAAREGSASLFVRQLKKLMAVSMVLGLLSMGAAAMLTSFGAVPIEWNLGLLWAVILLPSLPLSIAMMSCTRMLTFLGQGKSLLVTAGIGLVVNAVADIVLFLVVGPVGVIIATLLLRVVMVWLYAISVRRALNGASSDQNHPDVEGSLSYDDE